MTSPQVVEKQHQVVEERLAAMNLPDNPKVRKKKREQIEKSVRAETAKVAEGLVTRMDSVRFLRFFGVSLSFSFATGYSSALD